MTLTASQAKEKIGEALDRTLREDVTITRQGRPVAALIDFEEYERLRRREDAYWAARADEARKSGFLGPEETMRVLLAGMEGDTEEDTE